MMINNHFLYLFNFSISIIFFFLLGAFIQKIFNKKYTNDYFSIFSKILIGIIIFSITFALFKTSSKTILLGTCLLIIPFIRSQRQIHTINKLRPKYSSILLFFELFMIVILTYLIKVYPLFTLENNIIFPNQDYTFYAKLSEYISESGNESYSLDYIYNQNQVTPYHYIEIWATSSITYFLLGSTIFNLNIVVFGVFSVLIYLGFMSIVSTWKKPTIFMRFSVFLLMFFSALDFSFFQYLPLLKNLSSLTTTIWGIPKISVIYVFILLAIYYFTRKEKQKGLLSLLFLCFFYTPVAPAVVSGLFVWVLIDFFWYEKNKKILIENLFFIFYSILFIGLFYLLLGERNNEKLLDNTITFQYIKTAFNIIIGTNIQLIVIYSPIIVVTILFLDKIKKYCFKQSFIFLFVLVYLFSLLAWALMQTNLNSSQLFYNISTPIFHIFSILIILYSIFILPNQKIKIITFIFSGFFIFIGIYNVFAYKGYQKFENSFVQEIKKDFKLIKNKIGICFQNEDFYSSPHTTSNTSALGCYLLLFEKNTHTIDLTIFDIINQQKNHFFYNTYKKNLQNSIFYRFVEQQKQKNKFESIQQSQIDFIKEYKIEYLVASNNVKLSPLINVLIKKEIKDTISGERFIILK